MGSLDGLGKAIEVIGVVVPAGEGQWAGSLETFEDLERFF